MSTEVELAAALLREPAVQDLVHAITGASPSKEAVEWLGDVVRGRRARTQVKVLKATLDAIHASGLTTRVVPAKHLVSLLDYAGLEDPADEEMIKRWANLLANHATADDRPHIAFPAILSELEPYEALMLETMFARVERGESHPIGLMMFYEEVSVDRLQEELQLERELIDLGAANLARLRLVHEDDVHGRATEPIRIRKMWLTLLGYEFVRACQPPYPPTTFDDGRCHT